MFAMRHDLTYNDLFIIEQDITRKMQQSPAFRLFNYAKIQLFYQQAQPHLDRFQKMLQPIKDKYIDKDANGNYLQEQTPHGNKWKFKHTVSDIKTASILIGDKIIEAYERECTEAGRLGRLTITF